MVCYKIKWLCQFLKDNFNQSNMASKRRKAFGRRQKSHSRKTKKRLAIKQERLVALAAKRKNRR